MRISDWSSDVCSSDLHDNRADPHRARAGATDALMALDLDLYRQKLLDRRAELQREDESVVADRAPVALDQESVGRLSRIDAMQVQAMALARSEEHTSELQSLMRKSYAVFGLKRNKNIRY